MVEEEVDCDAEDLRESGVNGTDRRDARDGRAEGVVSPTPSAGSGGSGERRGAGYARHEIEGIGGVVKRKLVRMARDRKSVV